MDHKPVITGQFSEMEMYTSSEINKLSIDVWFEMKFLAMHITN